MKIVKIVSVAILLAVALSSCGEHDVAPQLPAPDRTTTKSWKAVNNNMQLLNTNLNEVLKKAK